jgi:hypothetical protein
MTSQPPETSWLRDNIVSVVGTSLTLLSMLVAAVLLMGYRSKDLDHFNEGRLHNKAAIEKVEERTDERFDALEQDMRVVRETVIRIEAKLPVPTP